MKQILPLAVLVFTLSGCGGERPPAGMPKLYPCTITITQEGKPLEMAMIALVAEEPDLAPWATGGFTDQNGNCIPRIRGKFKGVPAGKFKITVNKVETEPSKLGDEPPAGATPAEVERWGTQRSLERLKSFQVVAEKYNRPQTTDLVIEVLSKTNSFTLDVGAPVNILILPD